MLRRLLRVSYLTLVSTLIGACVMQPIKDQPLRDAAISHDDFAECKLGSGQLAVESKELKSTGLTGLIGGVLATALGENLVVVSQNIGLTSRSESAYHEQGRITGEKESVDGCGTLRVGSAYERFGSKALGYLS